MSEIPAGWYPDGNGSTRYWDGSAWTEHVQGVTSPEPPAPQQPSNYQRSSYMNSGTVPYNPHIGVNYDAHMTPAQTEHTAKMQKRIMGIVSLVIIVPFFLFMAFFIFLFFFSTGGEGGYRQNSSSVVSQLEDQIESQIGNSISATQCFVKESETQAQDLSGMVRIEEGRVFTCTFLDEVTGEMKTADMVITTLDTNHESILDTTWTSYATNIS